MIKKIEIKNFKSLKDISIPLKGLNVLMGLNGMGKSSFIQMLLLLRQSKSLEDGILDLNGNLMSIGLGRDAFYQFSEQDYIDFGIHFRKGKFSWSFAYDYYKEKLESHDKYTKDQMDYFNSQFKKLQYIKAERVGPKDIYDASSSVVIDKKQIGLSGEHASYFLNIYGHEYSINDYLKHPSTSSFILNNQIKAWMNDISPGVSINTKYISEINKVIIGYQYDLDNTQTNLFRPRNVGFGITYVLPVILALLTAQEGEIIIIENPESHIHPKGQAELGRLIALAAQSGAQIFIETHSDHILNGIRVAVKEFHAPNEDRGISSENVNILYFDKITTNSEQYSTIKQIDIDANGELSEYPKGFLDEWSNQLFKLI